MVGVAVQSAPQIVAVNELKLIAEVGVFIPVSLWLAGERHGHRIDWFCQRFIDHARHFERDLFTVQWSERRYRRDAGGMSVRIGHTQLAPFGEGLRPDESGVVAQLDFEVAMSAAGGEVGSYSWLVNHGTAYDGVYHSVILVALEPNLGVAKTNLT